RRAWFGLVAAMVLILAAEGPARTQVAADGSAERCPRPSPAAEVQQPRDVRSRDGTLSIELAIRSSREADGATRYCYVMPDGTQSPTLRLPPGDRLVLRLRNELHGAEGGDAPVSMTMSMSHAHSRAVAPADVCRNGTMSATSTNLHFHGLSLP